MNRLLGLLLVLTLTTAVGCQKGHKATYTNVKGTVTFNGKPIEKGQVTFAIEGQPPSTCDIVDGKFNGQAMIGSNKVSVIAKKKTGSGPNVPKQAEVQMKGYMEKFKAAPGEYGGPPKDFDPTMVNYIPPEWSTQSKQIRVVEAGAPNDFEFNIKGS